ncbi:MAG TPA: hypothetical protein VGC87_18760 [Pyrinomonadaceae bacterium]|jgi:hypothetical protein
MTHAEGFPVAEGGFGFFGRVETDTFFTMPAAFQLLPHRGSQEFYDGSLQPTALNLYEIETWQRHRWSIFDPSYRQTLTKKMKKMFSQDWQQRFDNFLAEREAYLKVVLTRARLFSEALDKKADLATVLKVFIFAGDCERTLRAALIAEENGQVKTFFRARKMKGNGLTQSMVEAKLFEPGDGRITRRSALTISYGESISDKTNLSFSMFGCEIHGDLPNNLIFQDNLLSILIK